MLLGNRLVGPLYMAC